MSWIFGVYSRHEPLRDDLWLSVAPPEATHESGGERFRVASGGFAETLVHETAENSSYVGVGIPMLIRTENQTLTGWRPQTMSSIESGDPTDGHYIFVKCTNTRITIWNDRHGLRTLYLYKCDSLIYFSTRLELLTRISRSVSLNITAFSTYWKAYNQLSHKCLLSGIERLPPGGKATITSEETRVTTSERIRPSDSPDIRSLLGKILRVSDRQSLGLSGGIDSRFLLTQLLRNKVDFGLHVFGNPNHPDAEVARRLSKSVGIPLRVIVESPDECDEVELLQNYCVTTSMSTSASAAFKFSHYDTLTREGCVAIDGSFGEFMRRQFFRRLRNDIRRSKVVTVDKFILGLKAFRGDIFRDEFEHDLSIAFNEEAGRIADEWKDSQLTADDFVDQIAMQFKYPNFYCYGQTWIDGMALSWMPLGQPAFLDSVYALTNLSDRTGGRLVKRMIREEYPELTRYPLVKGTFTYPFTMDYRLAWALIKVKKRLSANMIRSDSAIFLSNMQNWILDLIASTEVRSSAYIDYHKVSALATKFYGGDDSVASQLDWFVAFELWCRGVGI